MPDESKMSLRLSMAIVVLLSYMALVVTDDYTASLLLLPCSALLLMPFAEALDRRYPLYRRGSSLATLVCLMSMPFLFNLISLLDAVTFLVVYIQLYTVLHHKTERNYNHILLMSFFLILAASVMSPAPSIGLVFLSTVLTMVWHLSALEAFSAGSRHEGAGAIVVPLEGARNLHAEEDLGTGAAPIRWMTFASALSVVAFAALLFVFTPRMEAGLFGAPDGQFYQTGLSLEVDLTTGGQIQRDGRAVMRVEFPNQPDGRFPGELYWRTTALDYYTGSGWSHRGISLRPTEMSRSTRRMINGFAVFDVINNADAVGRPNWYTEEDVEQLIFLGAAPTDGLPVLSLAKAVWPSENQKGVSVWWDNARDFTIGVRVGSGYGGLQYRAWSEVARPSANELRTSEVDYLEIMDRANFGRLTDHNLSAKSLELVREITRNAPTRYDKVAAIERWFARAGFVYTLNVPDLPDDNPIEAFIHTERKGHCELYASAMALMVRSVGIPARVVKGYRGGEFNEADRTYTITADMAHLWLEVYFPEFGWVTFDPSPSLDETGLTLELIQRRVSRAALAGKIWWYRNVVGFSPERRFALLRESTLGLFRVSRDPLDPAPGPNSFSRYAPTLVPAAVIAAILFTGYAVVAAYRRGRRRHGLTPAQLAATEVYLALRSKIAKAGMSTRGCSAEEIRAFAGAFDDPAGVLAVVEAYNAVRFGSRPLGKGPRMFLRRVVRKLRPSRA